MTVEVEVLAEISKLRALVPGVMGSLVASLDGLLVTHDTTGIEPEGIAALAATSLGLGQRIATTVRYGDLSETTFTSAGGHVAVYAAGTRALLAVLATAETNIGLLHLEARQVAERVTAIIEVLDVDSREDLFDLDLFEAGLASDPIVDLPSQPPTAPASPAEPMPRRNPSLSA